MQSMGFGLLFSLLAGSGGGELLNYIDTATYWQQQNVAEVSVATITPHLVDKAVEPDKLDERKVAILIDKLGSADFDAREKASAELIAMGRPILPHLQKATKSDDAEVSLRAENLIKKIEGTSEEGDLQRVRRLMALRTLGELKDKSALPTLELLKKSERPFEAEYAQRAIDQINGKAYKPTKQSRKMLDADLALLPAGVGVVAQMVGVSADAPTLDDIIKGATFPPGVDPEQIKQQSTRFAVQGISHIGNVRIDSVTMAVTAPMTPRTGFVAFVVRGAYDKAALQATLTAEGRGTQTFGEVTVYSPSTDIGMIFLDDDRILVMMGEDEEATYTTMAKVLDTGKGTLADNKEMSKLIADVDKTSDVWAVSKLDDSYKLTPFLQPFDTAKLTGKRTDSGTTKLTLNAVGADAETVGGAVTIINAMIAQGKEQLKQIADTPMGPMVKPYQKMLDSVTVAQDGLTMTVTAEAEGDGVRGIMAPLFVGMPMSRAAHRQQAQPQIQRRQAAPVPVQATE